MRTFLLILTTALLTALWLIYALTSNIFPEFFALLPLPSYVSEQTAQPWTISPTGIGCTTPRGDQVAHGEVFLSFATETWAIAEGWCVSRSTVCVNGSRSAEQEPLAHSTCTLDTPKSCEVGGFIFAHGTSHEFFKLDEPTQRCTSEERTCTDGEVDGDESYTYLSCPSSCPTPSTTSWSREDSVNCPACPCLDKQPEIKQPTTKTPSTNPQIKQISKPVSSSSVAAQNEPNCPAPFGWTRRAPGQQGVAYKTAVASFGSVCEKVNIVCSFWSIRYGTKWNAGDIAGWLATTCRVAEPVACESACGSIKHGAQVTTYPQWFIPHGNGQTCETTKIVSTCTNGVLSPAGGNSCTCQISPPAACTAPNGKTVAHGGSLTLYASAQIQAEAGDGSDTCVRQWRKCQNGTFFDQWGNASPFTYQYESCTIVWPN